MRDESNTADRPSTSSLSPAAAALARAIESARAEREDYRAGRVAFQSGLSEAACTHPGSSTRSEIWRQGFDDARTAEETKRDRFR
ncbi:hypothetical protein U0C82_09910 [Fulvimarina sp. 2208YS6-2-32]|uniref:Uncharacterized protein n=1 Tax=Fulvimarina uroteuthidis TaxID=3098149 RepID=A0ABU5I257_9HYPH|nr:hypothetical protein [Fulvimarina sp. 2208YS6-2-32]MDY8109453.1 hypothetical protein [Fulvimarina sp. 2208YS6-2-32]